MKKIRKNSTRVMVMKYAHNIFRASGKAWSLCMKQAWNVVVLLNRMNRGLVEFIYKKGKQERRTTGSISEAKYLPSYQQKRMLEECQRVCFFDMKIGEYRSFQAENLIKVLEEDIVML